MKTPFVQPAWHRLFHRLRRRRPMSPIRRTERGGKSKFELIRLDDRIAPGSVFSTAAAQAVGLAGPLTWFGLGASSLSAISAAPATGSASTSDGPFDIDVWDAQPPHFSLTVPDSELAGSPTSRIDYSDSGDLPETALTDFGDPDNLESTTPITGGTGMAPTPSPAQGGGGTPVAYAPGSPRSGGVAVSGGLPAQPPAPQLAPRESRGANAAPTTSESQSAASPRPFTSSTSSPTSRPMPTPTGHFASQLQALLHTGDTGGGFSLTDTAAQQAQVGSLIGGQLSKAAGLGSADAASHRPASLMGQALNAGSNTNLGLRTSSTWSGMFGLVGSQSVGDLMSGPGEPGATAPGGALARGATTIAGAAPAPARCPALASRPPPRTPTPDLVCPAPSSRLSRRGRGH